MKNSIAIAFAFISFGAMAQLKGTVLGSNGSVQEPIEGAKVYLLNAKTGDITCDAGNFELILPRTLPDTLVFSALGYISDTVVVTKEDRFINMKVVLFADEVLPEIIVEYRKNTKTKPTTATRTKLENREAQKIKA